jgi:hypothetical protein
MLQIYPGVSITSGWHRFDVNDDLGFHLPKVGIYPYHAQLIIPLWTALTLVWGIAALTWYRRRHILPGHCRKCGYNLTGNTSGRCPECGSRA